MAEITTQLKKVMAIVAFEGLVFGQQIAEREVPQLFQPASGSAVWGFVSEALSVIQAIWEGLVFFTDLLTFNIPGAPQAVRVIINAFVYGPIFWDLITLVRGRSSN